MDDRKKQQHLSSVRRFVALDKLTVLGIEVPGGIYIYLGMICNQYFKRWEIYFIYLLIF